MKKSEFDALRERAAAFAHTSFTYLEYEHAASYLIEVDTDALLAARGYNEGAGMNEIHWAANDAKTLIAAVEKQGRETLVTFVPEAWKPLFVARGFKEYGVLRDYRIETLGNVDASEHACAPICEGDCQEAAAVTTSCRLQSREFHGETPEWIAGWHAGEDPDAKAGGARDCVVLACREGEKIAGVACVAVYESSKGPVLWLRELAVAPEYQGRGYGKSLVLSALRYGRAHGATRAFLMADDCNANAIALYKKIGFAPSDEVQIDMYLTHGGAGNN